jgi:hypothetical protein
MTSVEIVFTPVISNYQVIHTFNAAVLHLRHKLNALAFLSSILNFPYALCAMC